MLLPPERATLCQSGFSSLWLAQHSWASHAEHHCLCMAKHGGDLVAAWALDVHKVRVRTLDKSFLFMLSSLVLNRRVEEVSGQLELIKKNNKYIYFDTVLSRPEPVKQVHATMALNDSYYIKRTLFFWSHIHFNNYNATPVVNHVSTRLLLF